MIKTILFDLDGTLLPMNQETFTNAYMTALSSKLIPYGYDPQEIIKGVWYGVSAMVRNDGSKRNEQLFWEAFTNHMGDAILEHRDLFDDFYKHDFPNLSPSCGYTEDAERLIAELKASGYRLVLATNPIFPAEATKWRIAWAGLNQSDFELVSTYENSHYCKPNPMYYKEILDSIQCKPEECLMVGNDATEDMIAQTVGIPVFLLTDCLLNKEEKDISVYPHGNMDELRKYIQEHLS